MNLQRRFHQPRHHLVPLCHKESLTMRVRHLAHLAVRTEHRRVWILNSLNPKHGSIAKRQAEVGIGVTIANILDHGAQQFGIIGDLAFLDILTQQVT